MKKDLVTNNLKSAEGYVQGFVAERGMTHDGEANHESVARRVGPAGIDIVYVRSGDPGAPVVLLIMGLGMQLIAWPDALIRALTGAGYRVIRFDNRDIGLSQKTNARVPNLALLTIRYRLGMATHADYILRDMVEDARGVLDALDIARCHVIGVSMGGMILQRLALDHPERVRALVLVSTTDGAMILDKDIATIGAPRDYREVSKNMIVESFPAGTQAKLYQPLLERIPTWNGTVIREALTSMSQFQVHGQLTRIQVPTLIMVGVKDDVATPAIAKGIQAQIAGSQVVEFQTGHFMMAEDPDRFRTVLGDFLKGLPPSQ